MDRLLTLEEIEKVISDLVDKCLNEHKSVGWEDLIQAGAQACHDKLASIPEKLVESLQEIELFEGGYHLTRPHDMDYHRHLTPNGAKEFLSHISTVLKARAEKDISEAYSTGYNKAVFDLSTKCEYCQSLQKEE